MKVGAVIPRNQSGGLTATPNCRQADKRFRHADLGILPAPTYILNRPEIPAFTNHASYGIGMPRPTAPELKCDTEVYPNYSTTELRKPQFCNQSQNGRPSLVKRNKAFAGVFLEAFILKGCLGADLVVKCRH